MRVEILPEPPERELRPALPRLHLRRPQRGEDGLALSEAVEQDELEP